MLRHGMLSPNSKLLPQLEGDPARFSIMSGLSSSSYVSNASNLSLMSTTSTSSKHRKDARDTPQRRVRHRDGKLLQGGIGLTTGLGWSDRSVSSFFLGRWREEMDGVEGKDGVFVAYPLGVDRRPCRALPLADFFLASPRVLLFRSLTMSRVFAAKTKMRRLSSLDACPASSCPAVHPPPPSPPPTPPTQSQTHPTHSPGPSPTASSARSTSTNTDTIPTSLAILLAPA